MARPFLKWLAREQSQVRSLEDLSVAVVRTYRAELAEQRRRDGRPLQPRTLLDSPRVLMTFLRWARAEGYAVDPRLRRGPSRQSSSPSTGSCWSLSPSSLQILRTASRLGQSPLRLLRSTA